MTSKTLHEKLVIIQSELKAPKGQWSKFGQYHYRSCEAILEAVKPLLKEQGLILTIFDEMIMLGDRFYVKATAKLSGADKTSIEITAYAREAQTKKGMDESQITGAASSYARKYALNGLFLIDDTKDADAQEPVKEDKKPAAKPKKTQPPKANSYFEEWKAYMDKGIEAGYSSAVKTHIESIKWLKKDDEIKVKEYFTTKIKENEK